MDGLCWWSRTYRSSWSRAVVSDMLGGCAGEIGVGEKGRRICNEEVKSSSSEVTEVWSSSREVARASASASCDVVCGCEK
jgi:hypothetical protein